jgi:hypothetical protein
LFFHSFLRYLSGWCKNRGAIRGEGSAWQAAEKLKTPAKILIANEAKQSRSSMESMYSWIATPGFALLAMTNTAFFSAC